MDITTQKTSPTASDPRQDLAALLKSAGDELRLGILQALARDSYGVLELAQAFDVKQSGISHHLKVLANTGLVCTRREGNSIFYRRAPFTSNDPLATLKAAIFAQANQLPIDNHQEKSLAAIQQERAQASKTFFLENADKFKAQQDLIAGFDSYGKQVLELLNITPLPQHNHALEVGPGAGEFLPILAKRFKKVIAVDNSEKMLIKAKKTASDFTNINFQLGDIQQLNLEEQLDCIVINMVLHHTPSPSQVIEDVSQQLTTGGALLVTELCNHQQEWAREACGDIWLGLDPDELMLWAHAAKLELGQSTYLALRNGFQIQIQQFYKT